MHYVTAYANGNVTSVDDMNTSPHRLGVIFNLYIVFNA